MHLFGTAALIIGGATLAAANEAPECTTNFYCSSYTNEADAELVGWADAKQFCKYGISDAEECPHMKMKNVCDDYPEENGVVQVPVACTCMTQDEVAERWDEHGMGLIIAGLASFAGVGLFGGSMMVYASRKPTERACWKWAGVVFLCISLILVIVLPSVGASYQANGNTWWMGCNIGQPRPPEDQMTWD